MAFVKSNAKQAINSKDHSCLSHLRKQHLLLHFMHACFISEEAFNRIPVCLQPLPLKQEETQVLGRLFCDYLKRTPKAAYPLVIDGFWDWSCIFAVPNKQARAWSWRDCISYPRFWFSWVQRVSIDVWWIGVEGTEAEVTPYFFLQPGTCNTAGWSFERRFCITGFFQGN